MYKKLLSALAGVAMIAVATIVPVMAQSSGTSTPDVVVDVNDFLTFSIGNESGNCVNTPGGECPFGLAGGAVDLTSTGDNASAFATSKTTLTTLTNSTDGYNVTAFAIDTGSRTAPFLRGGGTGGTAIDQITDTVTLITAAQAENLDTLSTAEQDVDTGLAVRLVDLNTAADCRAAQEDTQWGTGDDNNAAAAAQANWASLSVAAADPGTGIMYSCPTFDASSTDAVIDYF